MYSKKAIVGKTSVAPIMAAKPPFKRNNHLKRAHMKEARVTSRL